MIGVALCLPQIGTAQQPLNAIDWLGRNAPNVRTGPVLNEPPVTRTALRPDVAVEPLQRRSDPIGLVPGRVTGLPDHLWRGSDVDTLTRLIAQVPVRRSPAMQTMLYTLLLSETRQPPGEEDAEHLILARLDRLMALGATDPAQSLAEQAGPSKSSAIFRRWFDATLLNGAEDTSCAELLRAPYLLDDYGARIFCTARAGDWQTAALTLEAAHALSILPPDRLALLDRFLSPDIYEGAPPLPPPGAPSPLEFRLYEAIGERLPTASLPRAFANADLRDVAGWRAQIEAAERLTRIGALPANRLLGLYTDRRPAASGGIWDRIDALQVFETALTQGSADAVAKTLPEAWAQMRAAELHTAFAEMFSDRLAELDLGATPVAQMAWRIQLLSANYETAAMNAPEGQTFLAGLAHGAPDGALADSATERAVSDGFTTGAALPASVQMALDQGQLGEAILLAMQFFDRGARGNPADLSGALAALRAVGLEDTARRAALHLILTSRG
ncbi:MAG: hypothetical protein CML02_17295 [Pseudooceanicola sp.]|nr:hypothetical protein [Pseudooceanicola sp.]